jgi:PAS domain-containing protein
VSRPPSPPDAARAACLAPVLLMVCDVEGRALWANDRWHETIGCRPGPEAPDWTAAVHPQDRPAAQRLGAGEGRETVAEVRLRAADGS